MGPLQCATALYQKSGIRGFYSGLKVNLLGVMPEKAIKLAANEYFREYFTACNGDGKIKIYQEMLSGAGAGFCQVIATNPMELVKIRLQLEGNRPVAEQRSTATIVKELGLRGVYKGTMSTLLRDVPFSFIFFPLYANIVCLLQDENGKTSLPSQLLAGSIAGGVGAGAVTPFDCIKTRLQMEGGITKYKNIAGAFRTIVKEEGWAALRQGMIPRMCVVSPLFGITLVAYEMQKRYMQG
jgi:solute carrier family 25 aspartate/glutamate transporter 12/13